MSTQRASRRKGTVTVSLSDADFAAADTLAIATGTTIQKWIADLVAARVVEERQKARENRERAAAKGVAEDFKNWKL